MSRFRIGLTANENNPRWKGDSVTYQALHNWVRRHFVRPSACENCGKNPGKNKVGYTKLQWANINKKYLRDRKDWKCLCPSCHRKIDIKNKTKHRYAKKT